MPHIENGPLPSKGAGRFARSPPIRRDRAADRGFNFLSVFFRSLVVSSLAIVKVCRYRLCRQAFRTA
jgi:hypothetical protein